VLALVQLESIYFLNLYTAAALLKAAVVLIHTLAITSAEME
jgi:hypothetical protein